MVNVRPVAEDYQFILKASVAKWVIDIKIKIRLSFKSLFKSKKKWQLRMQNDNMPQLLDISSKMIFR